MSSEPQRHESGGVIHRFTAGPALRGERLDRAVASSLPELSRSRVQSLLEAGRVRVDGRPGRAALRLKGGESLEVSVPTPEPALPEPEDLPLTILHQDRDLLVLDKPSGIVVHPAAGHARGTLVNALLHHVSGLSGVGGVLRPGIVHRLDKETSGCLVVAKNDAALQALQRAFQERTVEKTYLAVVHGHPPATGRLATLHARHPRDRKRFTGKARTGKPAVTTWRVRANLHGAALLEVGLETGRTHQIRVHLSEIGHPLLGDALYGGTRKGDARVKAVQDRLGRQALHAWRLVFPHPRTGKPVRCEAEVPRDLARAIDALSVST
ncbi:MAG TPA: RluA family pseudouridine synthase [Myxococcaceae bacterium]|nr:RluA family pseudouridine synthase [Myxococcaceae bacterium]